MSLATEPTPSPPPRSQLIALIEQLPSDRLSPALRLLEDLLQLPTETELLQKIQEEVDLDRERLDDLRDRCEWSTLTLEEHQELTQYEEQLEAQNVKRVEAMIQLAKLRNIDLPTLRQQLLQNQPNAA